MKGWKDLTAKVIAPVLAAAVVTLINGWFTERAERKKAEAEVYRTLDSYKAYIEDVMTHGCGEE